MHTVIFFLLIFHSLCAAFIFVCSTGSLGFLQKSAKQVNKCFQGNSSKMEAKIKENQRKDLEKSHQLELHPHKASVKFDSADVHLPSFEKFSLSVTSPSSRSASPP